MGDSFYFEKDQGYKQFMAHMSARSQHLAVFVGWLRSSGVYEKKSKSQKPPKEGAKPKPAITVAQIAAIMEFGSKDGRIPERSVIRHTLRAKKDEIQKLCRKLALQIIVGAMDEKKALGILGQFLSDLFRRRIQEGVPPPNRPATIARKGSSKTLIDTGQMVGSVDWELRRPGK